MRTVDTIRIPAAAQTVYDIAADVERWPSILPHYRQVRMRSRDAGGPAVVEMAAWRPFGRLRWPVWWVSTMACAPEELVIRYRHVEGVTRGMDVEWRVVAQADGSVVTVVHEWDGPGWPAIGRLAADTVIGPVFIHGVASRTLAGIAGWVTTHAPSDLPAVPA